MGENLKIGQHTWFQRSGGGGRGGNNISIKGAYLIKGAFPSLQQTNLPCFEDQPTGSKLYSSPPYHHWYSSTKYGPQESWMEQNVRKSKKKVKGISFSGFLNFDLIQNLFQADLINSNIHTKIQWTKIITKNGLQFRAYDKNTWISLNRPMLTIPGFTWTGQC